MARRILFEDGSSLEVSVIIGEEGVMAADAYKKLMAFIEEELTSEDDEIDGADLEDEDFDELAEEDLDISLDDDEEDLDIGLDDDEDWDDDDFDDRWG